MRIFRPTTLQLYILREFLVAFALAMAACTLFMLLGVLFMMAADYQELRVTASQIAVLSPYLLPKPLAYATPLAAMIAATMVFGRLSAESEILAAQAGGAPLRSLALPLVACGLVLTVLCLWFNQGALRWGWTTIRDEIFKINKKDFFKNLERPNNSVALNVDNGGMVRINWLPYEKENGLERKPIHIVYYQNQQAGRAVFARDYTADYKEGALPGEFILILTLKDAFDFGHTGQAAPQGGRPTMSDMQSFGQECTLELKLPQTSSVISIGESRGQKGWLDNYRQAEAINASEKKRKAFLLQRAADYGAHAIATSAGDPAAPGFCAEAFHETRIASDAIYSANGSRDRAHAEEAECYRKLGLSILPISMIVLGIGLGLLVQKSQRLIGFLLGIVVYALLFYPMMIVSKELARAGKVDHWVLFLPNAVLLVLGYCLWRAYERGSISSVSGSLLPIVFRIGDGIRTTWGFIRAPFVALRDIGVALFRYKTDGYVAGSFIVPLVVVAVVVGFILTALDLVEHGNEVIESVMRAGDPLSGPPRTTSEAILDAMSFYCIRGVEWGCDLLPLLILLSGVLCVTALVRNNEHLILKASGIRLQRAFRPIIFTALLCSVGVALLRQTAMPQLIMARDYLRPLVYRRYPAPTAVAMHTVDHQGKPVLFQMSQYSSTTRQGTNLRIFQVSKASRIPVIVADRAKWNGSAWKLETDVVPAGKDAKKGDVKTVVESGFLLTPEVEGGASERDMRPVRTVKVPISEWRGAVTPAFLESDRLGAGVMSLDELSAASQIKPELSVEWWRRISEWTMGIFLLWLVIPLLVNEAHGTVWAVGLSIAFGAGYWGLNIVCAEAARGALLPVWGPLIPAVIFFILGGRQYYIKMAT